jgi:hypothetical protein
LNQDRRIIWALFIAQGVRARRGGLKAVGSLPFWSGSA